MPKIESEKIDCLHRLCSRPAPRGKIESVRTHSEVIEQFDSFSLLKLLFLVRNWHCCSRKAFPRQMIPRSWDKTAKTAFFWHRWQTWKVVRSIGAVRQRPRTPRNMRCSFAFFESFLWHFNKKQRAEVIFRLSRPVSCKNQENGAGKQWSLHAPLNLHQQRQDFRLAYMQSRFGECKKPSTPQRTTALQIQICVHGAIFKRRSFANFKRVDFSLHANALLQYRFLSFFFFVKCTWLLVILGNVKLFLPSLPVLSVHYPFPIKIVVENVFCSTLLSCLKSVFYVKLVSE